MNFDPAGSIAILERSPAVLRTLLEGLSGDWTHSNEGPDTWSPFNVIDHLIDGEETDWMERAHIILEQGSNLRFEPFDRFHHIHTSKQRTLTELLNHFAELRASNLKELKQLTLDRTTLRLTGEHPEFGTVTLEQLLATWVARTIWATSPRFRVLWPSSIKRQSGHGRLTCRSSTDDRLIGNESYQKGQRPCVAPSRMLCSQRRGREDSMGPS
jgi:hypothetical protein